MSGRKIKVEMRANTRGGVKFGDLVEVDQDRAKELIREGHAISVTEAGKRLEREIQSSGS